MTGLQGPRRLFRRWMAGLRRLPGLDALRSRRLLEPQASDADLARVPRSGACILVVQGASHVEVAGALARLLAPVRADLWSGPPGARDAARAALARGCAVVAADAEEALALAQQAGALLVPGFVAAAGSFRSGGAAPCMRFARPLAAEALGRLRDGDARRAALAWRWLALERRGDGGPAPRMGRAEPVAPRGDGWALRGEAERLRPLLPHDRFLLAAARAPQIPFLLQEIGRLREIAFRDAGEGTGRALDLDAFDRSYTHLLVWDRCAAELVGAYRMAPTGRIVPAFGPRGLYTNTLFDYGAEFLERLGPAVELGRSFIRPEYQRSSQALVLLWRGIARLLAREPGACTLFGAVSVSARYSTFSRALLARGLGAQRGAPELARWVRPRHPLSARLARHLPDVAGLGDDPATVAALVGDAEADAKEPPVLVREYLKLGGRFVAWNLDPDFGDALDGLVVVDLRRTPRRLLRFYMGPAEAADFLERSRAA